MSERALFAVALVAFYGYYLLPLAERAHMYYVAIGVLIFALACILWRHMRSQWGRLACAVCAIEAAQQSFCGAANWGAIWTGQDICKAWLGHDPYTVIASLALAAAITWGTPWRRSKPRSD
ncbi:MAG: hypothetical protein ACO3GP_03190 [Candidatus Limnocylindrus sp.]